MLGNRLPLRNCLMTLQSHLHPRLGSKTCIKKMGGSIKCKVNKSLQFVVQNESVELMVTYII